MWTWISLVPKNLTHLLWEEEELPDRTLSIMDADELHSRGSISVSRLGLRKLDSFFGKRAAFLKSERKLQLKYQDAKEEK